MEESNKFQPSDAELEVLQVLWAHQPCSVRFIHEQILESRAIGYTTILKQLQRMTDKEMVKRYKEGKTHYYTAVPQEIEIQQTLFQRLKNTAYKGSTMKLVMHALGQNQTTEQELEELQEWLKAKKHNNDELH